MLVAYITDMIRLLFILLLACSLQAFAHSPTGNGICAFVPDYVSPGHIPESPAADGNEIIAAWERGEDPMLFAESHDQPLTLKNALHALDTELCLSFAEQQHALEHPEDLPQHFVITPHSSEFSLANINLNQHEYRSFLDTDYNHWHFSSFQPIAPENDTMRYFEYRGHLNFILESQHLYVTPPLNRSFTLQRLHLQAHGPLQYTIPQERLGFLTVTAGTTLTNSIVSYDNPVFGVEAVMHVSQESPCFDVLSEDEAEDEAGECKSRNNAPVHIKQSLLIDPPYGALAKHLLAIDEYSDVAVTQLLLDYDPERMEQPIAYYHNGQPIEAPIAPVTNPRIEPIPDAPGMLKVRGHFPHGASRIEMFRPDNYLQLARREASDASIFDWAALKQSRQFYEVHASSQASPYAQSFEVVVPAFDESQLTEHELSICKSWGNCNIGRGFLLIAYDKDGRPSEVIETNSNPETQFGDYRSIYAGSVGQYVAEKIKPSPLLDLSPFNHPSTQSISLYDVSEQASQERRQFTAFNLPTQLFHVLSIPSTPEESEVEIDGDDDNSTPQTPTPPGTEAPPNGAILIGNNWVCDTDNNWVQIGSQNGNPICGCPDGKIYGNQCKLSDGPSKPNDPPKLTDPPVAKVQECGENEIELSNGSCLCSVPFGFTRDTESGSCQCDGIVDDAGRCVDSSIITPPTQCESGQFDLAGECIVTPPTTCAEGELESNGECITVPPLPPEPSAGGCSLIL